MIRHILFWKLTEQVKAAGREKEAAGFVADSVRTMAGRIEGMRCAELGVNLAGGDYDLVFYSEFENEAALKAFRDHPLHVAHRERCAEYVTGRVAGDILAE